MVLSAGCHVGFPESTSRLDTHCTSIPLHIHVPSLVQTLLGYQKQGLIHLFIFLVILVNQKAMFSYKIDQCQFFLL